MKKITKKSGKLIFLIFLACVVICLAFLNFREKAFSLFDSQENIQELLKKSPSFEDFYFNIIKNNLK